MKAPHANGSASLLPTLSLILALPIIGCGAGNDSPATVAPAPTEEGPTTAFVDVTVIPMDRERVIAGQTVLVRGNRIVEMRGWRRRCEG